MRAWGQPTRAMAAASFPPAKCGVYADSTISMSPKAHPAFRCAYSSTAGTYADPHRRLAGERPCSTREQRANLFRPV